MYIVCLSIGILIILSPYILRLINQFNQTYVITKYSDKIEQMDDEEIDKQKSKYQKYNENLLNKKSFVNCFEQGEIIGYINIKKINVFLPIYEGTNDNTLLMGIGHLEQTSLPVANENYNAVFVGHNGISTKKYFDDLEELEVGDEFDITILKENFKYKVVSIKKILPNQTEDLKQNKKKKLVTLVTCTPKYVNSHRLLVVGENI